MANGNAICAETTAISFVRVLVIAAALKPSLLVLVAPALLSASVFAIGLALTAMFWRKGSGDEQKAAFRNPFGFWSVIGFALFLAAIIVLGRMVGESFGATGAILGAVAVGLADVDSVAVSIAQLTPQPIGAEYAALAILAAVASNTASKVAMGAALGRGTFAAWIAVMAAGCFLTGGAALWATFALNAR